MSANKLRTDFMKRKTLEERLREARSKGEKLLQHLLITVRFTLDYDQLVARVAHALRAHVVYRTDGGNFARGLIRSSSNLWAIGQRDQAIAYYFGADQRLPALISAVRALASALVDSGRTGEAHPVVEQCLQLQPSDPTCWRLRGRMAAASGHDIASGTRMSARGCATT